MKSKIKLGGALLVVAVLLVAFAAIIVAGQIRNGDEVLGYDELIVDASQSGNGGEMPGNDESIVDAAQQAMIDHAGDSELGIKVILNGVEVVFDVPLQVIDGRVMVPVCAIAEKLGAVVQWDEEMSELTIINFVDVSRDDWLYGLLRFGFRFGLITDVGGGRFEPDRHVTAAEFITMLGRLYEYGNEAIGTPGDSSCYERYFEWAVEMGIIDEEVHGELRPNGYITREQMAVVVARYFTACELWERIQHGMLFHVAKFSDFNDTSYWARNATESLRRVHLVFGIAPGGYFRPHDNVTRAEALVQLILIAERLHIKTLA